MPVRNRVSQLLREKAAKEKRDIPVAEIAEFTGMSRQGFYKWLRNEVQLYNAETMDLLCEYFNCDISDLLERIPSKSA